VDPGDVGLRDVIFGTVLSVVRAATYDEALDLVNANPYGNGTADLHQRTAGAARAPEPRSRSGWSASTCPDPGADGVLLLRRLEVVAVRRHPRPRRRGVHFFTRGKVVTSRWLDPSHAGVDLGFPPTAERVTPWLLIDYGEVISLPYDDTVHQRVAALLGITPDTLAERYWPDRLALDAGLPSDEYWTRVAGRTVPVDEARELDRVDIGGWARVDPRMLDLLDEQSAAGVRLALLSNAP
jgi:hypothetical protein